MSGSKRSRSLQSRRAHLLDGLSQEQRLRVSLELDRIYTTNNPGKKGNHESGNRAAGYEGWSLFRLPTTVNPPIVLRLLKRDSNGKLCQVISITEPKP